MPQQHDAAKGQRKKDSYLHEEVLQWTANAGVTLSQVDKIEASVLSKP